MNRVPPSAFGSHESFPVESIVYSEGRRESLIAINKELSVQYVLGYTLPEFAETLQLIADGAYDVAPLITDRVGLSGVGGAFAALRDPEKQAKILVEPWS